jgi:GAF domain-containing protein
MADTLCIAEHLSKAEKYRTLFPQLQALVATESDSIANMANVAAALHEVFHFFWVGFYVVRNDKLVLAPFQGPVACTRIARGRGVCGAAWARAETILVPDVEKFPGHIACSSLSKSEIVVPIIRNGAVVAVLDVDSASLNAFDETDKTWLEQICQLL